MDRLAKPSPRRWQKTALGWRFVRASKATLKPGSHVLESPEDTPLRAVAKPNSLPEQSTRRPEWTFCLRPRRSGLQGLKDAWWSGPAPRLSPAQKAELAEIVETGPDPAVDGVVRWRRVDLQKVIKARFGVGYHERYVSTLLKQLGFSHMSARPRHPAQDGETVEAYKKTSRAR